MSQLHILEVGHDHPSLSAGGTEAVMADLVGAFRSMRGIDVRCLVATTRLHRPGAVPGALEGVGGDLALCTGLYDRFSLARLDGCAWLASLARVLDAYRPDIVHLHGIDRLGVDILPALRRLAPRSRLVLTLHDYQLICPNDGLMLRSTTGDRCTTASADACSRCFPAISGARHALRRRHLLDQLDLVDVIISPSAHLKERFVAWGVDRGRIEIIPNPAPASRRSEAARERPNRFAYFGNFAPHKGIIVLLDAAARLREADLTLALHGGLGRAGEDVRQSFFRAIEAARPVARHLGAYERADVTALMQEVDWVVVPSVWWEGAPLVILEAQAVARPVICSGIGGMAELVRHDVDGLHVPPGDSAALAEVMHGVSRDRGLWSRLASAAPERPGIGRVAEAHLQIFHGLAGRAAA